MTDILLCKYMMMTPSITPYTMGAYSTTARKFLVDTLLQPKPVAFQPLAPLLIRSFQVDTTLK